MIGIFQSRVINPNIVKSTRIIKNDIWIQNVNTKMFTQKYRPQIVMDVHNPQVSMFFLRRPCLFALSVSIYWRVLYRAWRNHGGQFSARLVIIISSWTLQAYNIFQEHLQMKLLEYSTTINIGPEKRHNVWVERVICQPPWQGRHVLKMLGGGVNIVNLDDHWRVTGLPFGSNNASLGRKCHRVHQPGFAIFQAWHYPGITTTRAEYVYENN